MWTKLVKAGAYALAVKEVSDRVAEFRYKREKVIKRHGNWNLLVGITIGSVAGATAGILLAPRSGELTRQELARWSAEALDNLRENLERARADLVQKAREKKEDISEAVEQCSEAAEETVK